MRTWMSKNSSARLPTASPSPQSQRRRASAIQSPRPITASAASSRHPRVRTTAATNQPIRPLSKQYTAASRRGIAKAAMWKSRMLIPCSVGLSRERRSEGGRGGGGGGGGGGRGEGGGG